MLISEIANYKPKTISPKTNLVDVIKRMLKEDINGYVVVDDHEKVLGIISLQDIAAATVPYQFKKNTQMALSMYRRGYFKELCQGLKDKTAGEVMRRSFLKVNKSTNIMAIMSDFLKNDLYIVPIVENDKLVGIVTRTEIKHALAAGFDIEKHQAAELLLWTLPLLISPACHFSPLPLWQ